MSVNTIYGPTKPSLFALRGIRFIEGEDGAQPTPTPEPPKPEPAQETDWKAESRKWESRAKDNATAAQRLAEIEEANRTETEKAQARAEVAEKRAIELEQKATRAEVAAAKGIPMDLLSGSTKEELEASADALIAFKGEPAKGPVIPGQGQEPTLVRPDPGPGVPRLAAAFDEAIK